MDSPQRRINPAVISIIVIVLIAIAAGAAYAANSKNQSASVSNETQTQTQPTTTTSTDTSTTPATDASSSHTYNDGNYTATGKYTTPGGTESISVTITLAGDTISSVSAKGSASRGDSVQYQSKFLSGYESQVVGKDIDSVSLSRVSGSSLTSNGFNAAIEKIKDEAVS